MTTKNFEQMGAFHAYAPGSIGDILQTVLTAGTTLAGGNPALLGAVLLLASALAVQILNRRA